MISTPCGMDQLYYKTYNNAVLGKNDFHVTELRWYQDPRYNAFLKWQKFDEETKVLLAEYEEPLLDKEGTVAYDPEHWAMLEREAYVSLVCRNVQRS